MPNILISLIAIISNNCFESVLDAIVAFYFILIKYHISYTKTDTTDINKCVKTF